MKRYLLGIIFLVGLIGGNSQVSFGQATTIGGGNIITSNISPFISNSTPAVSDPIANFSLVQAVSNTNLTAVTFTTSGSYSPSTDITTFTLYVNTTANSINGSTPVPSATIAATGAGLQTIALTSPYLLLSSATAYYFFIVPAFGSSPVGGNTIAVSSISSSNIAVSGGSVSGAAAATGTLTILDPSITGTTPGSICGAGTVTLGATASTGATVNWYSVSAGAAGGTSLGMGTSYTTPSISSTTPYYPQASQSATIQTGTLSDNTTNLAGPYPYDVRSDLHWFSSTSACTINSVDIYPYAAGTVTIVMKDGTGTVVATSATATISAGQVSNTVPVTIPVGFSVPAGATNYQLGGDASSSLTEATIYRGTANSTYGPYPMTVAGFSLVGDAGGNSSGTGTSGPFTGYGARCYFYNWNISLAAVGVPLSSVTASVSTAPTITSTTPGSVCSSGAVTLGATSSAGVVNWYTASSGGASIFSGTSFTTPVISSSTTYWVDATNSGCTTASRTPVVASVTTMPVITSTTPASRCGAGTVALGATASGGTINWYIASTGGSSIFSGGSFTTPVISSTTTYWVAATGGGCATASRSAVTATINTIPTIASTTPASRCGAGTVNLAATVSAGNINWYTASTGGSSIFSGGTYTTPVISSTTTYWVDATSSGCTTTARSSVSATINTISVITGTTPAARCAAGTVTLAATASAGTINWYTASTGGSSIFSGGTYTTPVISSTTTYWVDATSSGCTTATRSSVTASVNSLPTITATAMPTPLCAGQTLNLNSSPAGGSSIYTNFTWTGPSGFSAATQNTSIAGIATSGAGTYNVTVTDNNGCVSASPGTTASVVVNALPLITATATPNPICAGQTLTLHSTPTGGGGTYVSYAWHGPASFTASSQNTSILNIAAGQAGVYSVTVTDNNGCTSHIGATTSVVVNPLPVITAAATPNPICATATLSLTATPGGGTPPYTTFTWSGPGGFTAGTQNNTIANIAASGAGVYSVTVTDNKGCTSANPGTTAAVVVNPLPSSIAGATNVCVGSVTTLNATPATGTWNSSNASNAAVVSGTGVVSGISAGNVVITYTLPTGCLATTQFTVNPLPASISGNAVLCSGQTTTLSDATLPGSWHSDNTNAATIIPGTGVITGVGLGGTATITYTLGTGCTTTENVTINPLPPTPVITTTTPTTLCLNTMYQSFGASAPGVSESYEWTATNGMWAEDKPNNQNCLVNFTTQGFDTIVLTATNSSSHCQSHAMAVITVTVNSNSSVQTDSVINFESSLICLQTGVKYLWGYDVASSLSEDTLPSVSPYNNTSQNYYFSYSPNFTDTLFWVKTTDPATGCFEKSYYYAPAKSKGFNTNTSNGGLGDMKVYPNPAGNYLNVLFDNVENNVTLKISDIMGREMIVMPVQNVLTGIDVSGLQPSVYFLECYQNGVRVADSKFIKN